MGCDANKRITEKTYPFYSCALADFNMQRFFTDQRSLMTKITHAIQSTTVLNSGANGL